MVAEGVEDFGFADEEFSGALQFYVGKIFVGGEDFEEDGLVLVLDIDLVAIVQNLSGFHKLGLIEG